MEEQEEKRDWQGNRREKGINGENDDDNDAEEEVKDRWKEVMAQEYKSRK